MPVDVLIVGQGLAGSLLAWELIRQQFSVMVVDRGGLNASQVAAGLINPVTGKRLVKSEAVDTYLSVALACYRELGVRMREDFFVPLAMWRLLRGAEERRFAERRLQDKGYQGYLAPIMPTPAGLQAEYGVLQQRQTGYLRTTSLLTCLREFLVASQRYRQTEFDYGEIQFQPRLRWRDLQPAQIVFCEGHLASANPWFGNLPFQPAKGEILSCQLAAPVPQVIVNYGDWLLPTADQHCKIGATFTVDEVDDLPTVSARQALLARLAVAMPGLSPTVIGQQAGIRPTTLDKQPFVGTHPRLRNLHVFNGFGAKGSLAIPYHARQFAAALRGQTQLPVFADIQRYHDSHFADC